MPHSTTVVIVLTSFMSLNLASFLYGRWVGRMENREQLRAARVAMNRAAWIAEVEHTAAAKRHCTGCRHYRQCGRHPKPDPAPACYQADARF
jgi:hypothetical protein